MEGLVNSKEVGNLLDFYLGSDDDAVRSHILDHLVEKIPFGHQPQRLVETIEDPALRCKARQCGDAMERLERQLHIRDLEHFLITPKLRNDIEIATFLVNRLSGALHSPSEFIQVIDRLAEPLLPRMDSLADAGPEAKLKVFLDYLFVERGFRGNRENYYDPENSYLLSVIENGRGNPISLSVLTMFVGRRAGLRFEGMSLPGHFIVRFRDEDYAIYVDPFNEGNLLTDEDCTGFMLRQGVTPTTEHFFAADALSIIRRIYRNLLNYYMNTTDIKKEATLNRHLSILQNYTSYR